MSDSTALMVPEDDPRKNVERIEGVAVSMAAKSKAGIEARYLMAMKTPRSWMQVRSKLLEACERPGFAAGALWKKPMGGKQLEGPSIRFAEEVARCAGNLLVETTVIHDGEDKQVMCVTVTDLEANLCYPLEMSLDKTVERQSVGDRAEGSVISVRTNTYGKKVYTVRATEDEMAVKRASWASKLMRTGILRIAPADIVEEAIALIKATMANADRKDPKEAARKVADAYLKLGVEPTQLEEYLGHTLDRVTEFELADLRAVYTALSERESTWAEVMEAKQSGKPVVAAPVKDAAEIKGGAGATKTSRLKEELLKQKAADDAANQREPGEENA